MEGEDAVPEPQGVPGTRQGGLTVMVRSPNGIRSQEEGFRARLGQARSPRLKTNSGTEPPQTPAPGLVSRHGGGEGGAEAERSEDSAATAPTPVCQSPTAGSLPPRHPVAALAGAVAAAAEVEERKPLPSRWRSGDVAAQPAVPTHGRNASRDMSAAGRLQGHTGGQWSGVAGSGGWSVDRADRPDHVMTPREFAAQRMADWVELDGNLPPNPEALAQGSRAGLHSGSVSLLQSVLARQGGDRASTGGGSQTGTPRAGTGEGPLNAACGSFLCGRRLPRHPGAVNQWLSGGASEGNACVIYLIQGRTLDPRLWASRRRFQPILVIPNFVCHPQARTRVP